MENSFKEFIYFHKNKIIGFILTIIVIGGGFLTYYIYDNKDNKTDTKEVKTNNILVKEDTKKEETKDETKYCYYDIKGSIKKPGVYKIDCNKRIIDAIEVSGGLSKNADTSVINLSKQVYDGMVIKIYSKSEVNNYLKTIERETKKESICNSENIKNDACINNEKKEEKQDTNNSLVNINTASLEVLTTLPGIGESKAKSIIAYRDKNKFSKIEDIMNVEGIGESLFVKIKENITV